MSKQKLPPVEFQSSSVAKDYQVCVRIIEARELAGLELTPTVCIRVGQETKKTQTKSNTNSPFYDEYFVFEFNQSASEFFDQVITLTVETRVLLFTRKIGDFKIDVATVYAEEFHGFFRKWAVLINSAEPDSGAKGYLKVDLIVTQKGDIVSYPPAPPVDEEDEIDENLLIPEGTQFERLAVQYIFSIFHGKDILSLDDKDSLSSLSAKEGQRVSPYVRVLFAGLSGMTSISKRTSNPLYNESITILHMFPPLLRRVKIQLRDDISKTVLGTAFIDLNLVSDDDVRGFSPTFGPAYLNFYGGLKKDPFPNRNPLNFGMGDGICYRGRVFLSFEVRPVEQPSRGVSFFKKKSRRKKHKQVSVQALKRTQIAQLEDLGTMEEFFLFGMIFEATSIQRHHAELEPMHFELSIGHIGKVSEGSKPEDIFDPGDYDDVASVQGEDPELLLNQRRGAAVMVNDKILQGLWTNELILIDEQEIEDEKKTFRSTTDPCKAVMTDEFSCRLPFHEAKPCLFIRSRWPNDKHRMISSNVLQELARKIDNSLKFIDELVKLQLQHQAVSRLRLVLNQIAVDCRFTLSMMQRILNVHSSAGRTNNACNIQSDVSFISQLDVERFYSLQNDFELICKRTAENSDRLKIANVEEVLAESRMIVNSINRYARQAQMSLPDVFLWLMAGNRRIAYARLPSEKLLFSSVEEERGALCGKLTSVFMKQPVTSENSQNDDLWEPQAEVTALFWLGLSNETGDAKEGYLSTIPKGFKPWTDFRKHLSRERSIIIPPKEIRYDHSAIYELRCHFYIARALIGADDSGLSDPFVRVIFQGASATTQYCEQTVNPCWDEMLVLTGIHLYGTPTDIQKNPPRVAVQIFDNDIFGKNEFIGEFETLCAVKLAHEPHCLPRYPPPLKWHQCRYQGEPAGEVLAAFELFEVCEEFSDEQFYPSLPEPEDNEQGYRLPLPDYIRPKLTKFYVEALFWGLRDLKPSGATTAFLRPALEIECAGQILRSEILTEYKSNPNFVDNRQSFEVSMPENPLYRSPIILRCIDCQPFGRTALIGSYTIARVDQYLFTPEPLQQNGKSKFGASSVMIDLLGAVSKKSLAASKMSLASTKAAHKIKKLAKRMEKNVKRKMTMHRRNSDESDITDEDDNDDDDDDEDKEGNDNDGYNSHDEGGIERRRIVTELNPETPVTSRKKSLAPHLVPAQRKVTMVHTLRDAVQPQQQFFPTGPARKITVYHMDDRRRLSLIPIVQAPKSEVDDNEEGNGEAKSRANAKPSQTSSRQATTSSYRISSKKDNVMMNFDWWTKYIVSVERFHQAKAKSKNFVQKAAVIGNFANLMQKRLFNQAKTTILAAQEVGMGMINMALKDDKPRFQETEYQHDALLDFEDLSKPEEKYLRTMKIIPHELEAVPKFDNFEDQFKTFPLYRGKESENESRLVGKFKGNLKLCKFPLPRDIQIDGFWPALPRNEMVNLVVRVYVVKATGLAPSDSDGKADPYLIIRAGNNKINDKSNYQPSTLRPTFGRCFELPAVLPRDSELTIEVWDWDRISQNDFIGSTTIDLENRYYTCHRATVGLALEFDTVGYNEWRDNIKPSQILEDLCEVNGFDPPVFETNQVKVAGKWFRRLHADKDEGSYMDAERTALYALHRMHEVPEIDTHLVSEHVETRPLYHPKKPGMEQGRIELWVDIFQADGVGPGPVIDIAPRKPEEYELRVTIYDTRNVPLNDYNLLEGLRMSDIYVKGFLTDADVQQTDVHYRSLNGEGNFNWRFKFKFKYLPTENKIVVKKRERILSIKEAELRYPCRLSLQVWDADTLTGNDQLGMMELDLSRLCRGKKLAANCSWRMFDPSEKSSKVDLFRQKRMRGWWPFVVKNTKTGQLEDAGKVEMELELVTEEDAIKKPAGFGREEPDALPMPKRPDTSFAWFNSPLKLLRYGIWDSMKYKLLILLLIILGFVFVGNFVFNIPTYLAAKTVGVGAA